MKKSDGPLNYRPDYDPIINKMKDRGLIIKDRESARRILEEISPFHLANFGLQWMTNSLYKKGTSIEMLYEVYHADRAIKNFLFDYLADMEVQLRNLLGSILHEKAGAYGYLDVDNFKNNKYHETFIHDLENELRRANEPFVRFFREDEEDKRPVPIYVALEVVTMGSLSKLVSNLKRPELKKLASFYGLKTEQVIPSFLKSLTILRNTCAHHGRLSLRNFNVAVSFLKDDLRIIDEIEEGFSPNPYAFFASFMALIHILPVYKSKEMIYLMDKLFSDHPFFEESFIDFPTGWKEILLRIVEYKEVLEYEKNRRF